MANDEQLDAASKQAADNILRAAKAERYNNVYFLGPYARRVSFASQQNRALNLVWALRATNLTRGSDEIAIIGAGIAGLTAAAALLERGHRVTIYETKEDVLSRHVGVTHRFIHPTINRWPEFEIVETTTVPYFDWLSATCRDLVLALRVEWAALRKQYAESLKFKKRVTVTRFGESSAGVGVAMKPAEPDTPRVFFKVAIVTSGFADEHYGSKGAFPGYWEADDLDAMVDDESLTDEFLVSGCGDGGLIDALRLAHRDFDHGRLIIEVAKELERHGESWTHAGEIVRAEREVAESEKLLKPAIANGSNALRDVYESAAAGLPAVVRERLNGSLRSDRALQFIKLLSKQEHPYSPMSAPIHKLLIAHAIEQQVIEHISCVVEEWGASGVVTAPSTSVKGDDARRTLMNGYVVLRHGAKPNFERFFPDEPGMVQGLVDRQKLVAGDLDDRIWATGGRPLVEWPPRARAAVALSKREKQAGELIARIVGAQKGFLHAVESKGFIFKYHNPALSAQDVRLLPSKIFGFDLEPVPVDLVAPAMTEACGAPAPRGLGMPGDAVCPGMPIDAGLYGRLGPILTDGLGNYFALTAAHVAPCASDPLSVLDRRGRVVGHVSPCDQDDECRKSDLALIRLVPGLGLTPSYGGFPRIVSVAPENGVLARGVVISRPERGFAMGYVCGTGLSIAFRQPGTGETVVISDALQIRSRDPTAPFAERGDSGAPVIDDDGALVGMLLSRDKEYAYAQPLRDLLVRLGLELLSAPVAPDVCIDGPEPIAKPFRTARDLYARVSRRDQDVQIVDLGGLPSEVELAEAEAGVEMAL